LTQYNFLFILKAEMSEIVNKNSYRKDDVEPDAYPDNQVL
jgi:hypothetical protein